MQKCAGTLKQRFMNEVIKYNNDLNNITFRGLEASEHDIFMVICSALKDKSNSSITLSYDYIKDLIHFDQYKRSDVYFFERMEILKNKLMDCRCNITMNGGKKRASFSLFPTFYFDDEKQQITIKINEDFAYLLNDFSKYTQFELEQFVSLKHKYSKTLYRQLKQFRFTGKYERSITEFKEIMGIPENYRNNNMVDKIIKPAVAELSEYFEDLRYVMERDKSAGGSYCRVIFYFKAAS